MVAGKTAPWSILALGIGNFGDAAAAALQLAVLIQVVDMLACKRVEVYDPIFTEVDISTDGFFSHYVTAKP